MSEHLVGVKYIGLKARKEDNVAGTGLIWTKDQIHVLPASLVPKFQKHPDVWEIVPAGDLMGDELPNVGLVVDKLGATQQELEDNLTKEAVEAARDEQAITEHMLTQEDLPASFDPMTKADIAAFAQRNYGLVLEHTRMTKDALIDAVRATHNGRVQM